MAMRFDAQDGHIEGVILKKSKRKKKTFLGDD